MRPVAKHRRRCETCRNVERNSEVTAKSPDGGNIAAVASSQSRPQNPDPRNHFLRPSPRNASQKPLPRNPIPETGFEVTMVKTVFPGQNPQKAPIKSMNTGVFQPLVALRGRKRARLRSLRRAPAFSPEKNNGSNRGQTDPELRSLRSPSPFAPESAKEPRAGPISRSLRNMARMPEMARVAKDGQTCAGMRNMRRVAKDAERCRPIAELRRDPQRRKTSPRLPIPEGAQKPRRNPPGTAINH